MSRRAALAAAWLALAGAAPEAVPVIRPKPARITRYFETAGTAAATQSVDLLARVAGTLDRIDVADGAVVKKGSSLFVIEPLPYQSKLRQAQAAEDQQRAALVQAEAEYGRQAQLRTTRNTSQSTLDTARANRDGAAAALHQAEEATRQAAITYTYTHVTAPFDGVVTAHLVSAGELVGANGPTKLATILALDPIWVNASLSEAEVARLRAMLAARGLTVRTMGPVPAEAALAGETGFPHRGTLDYVAPLVDAATGTLAIRARFDNARYALLPGNFVRLRFPIARDVPVLLVPDEALAADQGADVLRVVAADGTVRAVQVTTGENVDGMRVVEGIAPDARVVASAAAEIVPGARVRITGAGDRADLGTR